MPSREAESAAFTGMWYTATLITMVSSRVRGPAICPFMRLTARAQKRKTMGRATTRAVSRRLPLKAE